MSADRSRDDDRYYLQLLGDLTAPLKDELVAVNSRIENLDKKIDAKDEKLDNKIEKLDDKVDQLQTTVNELKEEKSNKKENSKWTSKSAIAIYSTVAAAVGIGGISNLFAMLSEFFKKISSTG